MLGRSGMFIEDLYEKGSDLVGEYSFRRRICLQSRDDELGKGHFGVVID